VVRVRDVLWGAVVDHRLLHLFVDLALARVRLALLRLRVGRFLLALDGIAELLELSFVSHAITLPGDAPGKPLDQHVAGHAAHAEHPRAGVSRQHRADLGEEDGVVAEDPTALLDEPLGLVLRLDVLDDPAVGT
jgi:hypothetical protein